jgi:uncharacterized protein (TIGR02284 family)
VAGQSQLGAILNDLIATCDDGAVGFRTAADAVSSGEARTMLAERARRIEMSKGELADLVRKHGEVPDEHGHAMAGLHRGWIQLKSTVTGHSDDAILAEVERGEETAVKHYRHALDAELPADVRMVVEAQARGAEMNLTRVQSLRRAASTDLTGGPPRSPENDVRP